MKAPSKKYNAFISYTHKSEMPLAIALEQGLERYAKPLFKMRALEIYRDTESQALTPDLLAAVHHAMDDSDYLVLLASPESAASPWVPRELVHWCENHGVEKLLVVLCAGRIAWDNEKADFDWEKTDALPRELSGYFRGSPLYLDMTWARGRTDLDQHNPDFKDAVSRLSATLHGKSIGDMYSEEARQFKRTRRIKNATISGLGTLLIISCIAGVMAYIARNEAIFQKNVAIKKNLVNEVRNQLNNNEFIKALQIGRAARGTFGEDTETNKILWQLVSHPTTILTEWPDAYADTAEISSDHEWVMIWTENADLTSDLVVRNWRTGKEIRRGGILNAWFIDNNTKLLEVTFHPSDDSTHQGESSCPEGRTVYAGGEWTRKHVSSKVVDLSTGQFLAWPGEPITSGLQFGAYDGKVDPNWAGSMAQLCGDTVQLFNKEGQFTNSFEVPDAEWVVADSHGELLSVITEEGVQLYDSEGHLIAGIDGYDPVFSDDGKYIATVVYDQFPFDFDSYAVGVSPPTVDEKMAYLLTTIATGGQVAQDQSEDGGSYDKTYAGFTIIWKADGSRFMQVPGVNPVFAMNGVFTVGGFDFKGFIDKKLRLWGLDPVFDGGRYDQAGGRAPFIMELEGNEPMLSSNGRWLSTNFEDGTNVYSASGAFSRHLPGYTAGFLGDFPILLTQSDSWTRLWYLPRMSNDLSNHFKVAPDSEFALDHCLGVPWGKESDKGYYVDYPEDFYLFNCASMPPSTSPKLGFKMPMEVTRPVGGNRLETISVEAPSCHAVMERYHQNLYLMSCGEGMLRLFDLDTISPDQPFEYRYKERWHGERLVGAVFSADGRYIAAASSLGVVKIWETQAVLNDEKPAPVEFYNESDPHTVLFSPDSRWLLTAAFNSPIKLWDLSGNELTRSQPPEKGFQIYDVMFSDDGKMLHVRLSHETESDSYWNRSIDFDALLDEFSWLPDLSFEDQQRLGLAGAD